MSPTKNIAIEKTVKNGIGIGCALLGIRPALC